MTFFVLFILSDGNFSNICVSSQCIVYWIHFQNTQTFTYQKTLLHALLLFVFKIVESLQCILNKEITLTKDYVAWNGFPKRIANSIIKRALQMNDSNTIIKRALQMKDSNAMRSEKSYEDSIKIFFSLNCSGETTELIVKSCIKKLHKSFKREIDVKFFTQYKT